MEQTYSLAERSLFCYNGPEVTSVERPSIQLHGNRVAVFSDIHSNYYALEVCYANTHPDAFTDEKVGRNSLWN